MSAGPPDALAQAELAGRAAISSEQAATRSEGAVADSVRFAGGWRFGLEPQVGD